MLETKGISKAVATRAIFPVLVGRRRFGTEAEDLTIAEGYTKKNKGKG